MIYKYPTADEPIQQGDIFVGIPKVEVELSEGLAVVGEDRTIETIPWAELAKEDQPISAVLGVQPVAGIVITQDCDARRSPDITLCEIRDFFEVERKLSEQTSPKKIVEKIIEQSKINLKWFYLPADQRIGFTKRMAVDLLTTLRMPRQDLADQIGLRRGRLNEVASDHFRERIAYFFRRYAYDEWYPFSRDEIVYYPNYPSLGPSDLFPWQK